MPFQARQIAVRIPVQCAPNPTDCGQLESIILPQGNRSSRAVQMKHRLTSIAIDVNMLRPMVVGLSDNPEPVKSEDGGHYGYGNTNPTGWVYDLRREKRRTNGLSF